jgi:hypothetical protein
VGVPVRLAAGVGVDVPVGCSSVVAVGVDVVEAASPPGEKPHGQQYYDAPDGDLGDLADHLGQVPVQENERQADEHERGPVPQAPE